MSQAYEGQDPIQIAKQAERDLNSEPAKGGHGLENSSRNTKQDAIASDSSTIIEPSINGTPILT